MTDKQFLWQAMKALVTLKDWNELERLFVTKVPQHLLLVVFQNLLLIVLQNLLLVVFQNLLLIVLQHFCWLFCNICCWFFCNIRLSLFFKSIASYVATFHVIKTAASLVLQTLYHRVSGLHGRYE